jgi:hypothetical protein
VIGGKCSKIGYEEQIKEELDGIGLVSLVEGQMSFVLAL